MEYNYGRWIADMDDTAGASEINYSLFDRYLISVNSDVIASLPKIRYLC